MCIQVQQITYIHPDKEVLFRNLSFTVGRGRQLALIGNNGCGKSTLLQIMAGNYNRLRGTCSAPTTSIMCLNTSGNMMNEHCPSPRDRPEAESTS